MILAARKIDIEQDDRGHDSDHSDGMISCEDLAEHRDAYDGVAMTGSEKVSTAALPVSIWERPVVYRRNGARVETSPSSRE